MLKYNVIMDQNANAGGAPQNQNVAAGPTMPAVNVMPNAAAAMPPMGAAMPPSAQIPQYGEKKGSFIETAILIIVCIVAAVAIVAAVYFYMQWNDLNTNYEIEKNEAIQEEVKKQQEADEKAYQEQEKIPTKQFTGPSDYGTISFKYPKNWSVYIKSDGSDNSDFEGYFAPGQINDIDDDTSRYALRFNILNSQYNDVVSEYNSLVEDGLCTSSAFSADSNKLTGTMFYGQLDENINGIVVVVRVNDKSVVLRTDAEEFRADFETLIGTLRRNS